MLIYTITGDNVTITDEIRAYIEKRFGAFEKFVDKTTKPEVIITASKITAHDRDDSFRIEAKFKIHQRDFFAVGSAGELYAAIDDTKDELLREVTSSNARRRTLFHRGARKLKSLVKRGLGQEE